MRGLLDPHSWSGKLLFEWTDAYEWVVSPEIVAEYLQVIRRPSLVSKYRTIEHRDPSAILALIATATLVHPTHVPSICHDPGDDKFLAAASSVSRCIVSADVDLLAIGVYEETEIVSPEAFLRILESVPPQRQA